MTVLLGCGQFNMFVCLQNYFKKGGLYMSSIISIRVLNKRNKEEINRSIDFFLQSLKNEWAKEEGKISDLIQDEFYSDKSIILQAKNFEKFVGSICISPFNIVGFPDDKEKQKLIEFFNIKGINQRKIAHIGGLGLDPDNSRVDLMQWARILIFAATKTVQHQQRWIYAIGQVKTGGFISKLALQFRYRKISVDSADNKSWYLKKIR